MPSYRYCSICTMRLDEAGRCPTPEACDRLKRPHARRIGEARKARTDARRATVEDQKYEIGPLHVPRTISEWRRA